MKSCVLLACLLSLCGCASTPHDAFGPRPPEIFYQVYGFQPDQPAMPPLPEQTAAGDASNAEVNALAGTAGIEFSFMRLFEKNGIKFDATGSFVSVDAIANHALRIGTPYRRYYIVVANTPQNLDRADTFVRSKMNGTLLGPRKEMPQ